MKKLILSFVALLAVGTMAKAANEIVDGVYPASMTPETNPELCTQWDFTTVTFNATGDVFPIYDDCQTNVYFTMTEVAKGGIDYETFLFEISASDGTYFTGCGQNNAWNCCAGLPVVRKVYDGGDDEFPFPQVGDYVLSVAKMDENIVKVYVSCPEAIGHDYIWYADYTQNGGNSIVNAFHMGGENCTYTISEVNFTEVTIAEATYTGSVTGADSWWEQTDLGKTALFGTVDPADATYIEFTSEDNLDFTVAYNVVDETSEGGTSWNTYTFAQWAVDGVMTVSVPNIFWDDPDYVISIIFTAGTSNTLNVSWTVHTEAVSHNAYITAIEDIKADVEVVEVARYNLAGQKIAGEQKGINIIKYSDGSSKKVLVK